MADEEVSHEALGGPPLYSPRYGDETSVVRIHSGNGAHEEMDRRAIACVDQALADIGLANTGLAADERLRQVLHDYFAWATTTTMARYHPSQDQCRTAWPSRTGPGTGSRKTRSELAHQRPPGPE